MTRLLYYKNLIRRHKTWRIMKQKSGTWGVKAHCDPGINYLQLPIGDNEKYTIPHWFITIKQKTWMYCHERVDVLKYLLVLIFILCWLFWKLISINKTKTQLFSNNKTKRAIVFRINNFTFFESCKCFRM